MFSLLQAEGSNNSESSSLYSTQSSSDSGGKKSRKSRRKAEKKSKESSVTVRFACVSTPHVIPLIPPSLFSLLPPSSSLPPLLLTAFPRPSHPVYLPLPLLLPPG